MPRGKRESQWLVIRRCLAIIQRVQHGPTDWKGLIQAVLAQEGEEAYGHRKETLPDLLHDDLARIRQSLHIDIRADPRTKQYIIQDMGRPLLDLPSEDLTTIAWLEQTFGPDSPRYEAVRSFLTRLRFYLSPKRRLEIEQQRTGLTLKLGQQDEDQIRPEVEVALQEALVRRRRVEFDYLSPKNETGQTRRHVVDVYEPPRFEAALGHYYLQGWCHYNVGPIGPYKIEAYVPYRLGRISNLRLLPNKLPASPPLAKRYQVEYWLSARVSRRGITRRHWIDIETIEQQADDSVIVYGITDDIFFAVQELMHYRHNCRVLGGPEMLARMKETVHKMAELYQEPE